MTSTAPTPAAYLAELPEDRRLAIEKLRETILENLPDGFREEMAYGMIGYVVPHSLYPPGYHCDPKQALPFVSIASQKNFIALYHMGIYASPELLDWFVTAYPQHSARKLDMGKSCIRFKHPEHIPYALLGQLLQKMTVEDWVSLYESAFKRS